MFEKSYNATHCFCLQAGTPARGADDFNSDPVVSAGYGLNHRLMALNPFGMN